MKADNSSIYNILMKKNNCNGKEWGKEHAISDILSYGADVDETGCQSNKIIF